MAAGLDGVSGTIDDATVTVLAESGRDPSTIVTHDGETVVTWIDEAGEVNLSIFALNGTAITVPGADFGNLGTVVGGALGTNVAKVVDLAGAGFAVVWMSSITINIPGLGAIPFSGLVGRVFTPGAAAGTYTEGNVIPLAASASFTGEFSLSTLPDTGGFAISWGEAVGGTNQIKVATYDSTGVSDGTTLVYGTSGTHVATAGLIGDRIVGVYQAPGAGADIVSQILDTRTPGVVLTGDDGGNGRIKPLADQLVGTIGDDTLSGLSNNDELYGALGNDTLTGGTGDDVIIGGGGNDTAVYEGNRDQYVINYLGGDLFSVQDLRNVATNEGVDTVRGVENFRFQDVTVTAASIIGDIVPVTPTAWGQIDASPGAIVAVNPLGTPDVDGFVVNHSAVSKAGTQANAFVADSVGEFIGVVWETPNTGAGAEGTHIRAQFYDVILNPDQFIPNAINVSDGLRATERPALSKATPELCPVVRTPVGASRSKSAIPRPMRRRLSRRTSSGLVHSRGRNSLFSTKAIPSISMTRPCRAPSSTARWRARSAGQFCPRG